MRKLTPPPVSLETRRDLLAAALDFRAVKPWELMGDAETLAWEDPVTQRLRMGVVLGWAGTMFGLAVYRGELGLCFVLKTVLREDDGELSERDGVEMDALRVEFTKKGDLQPEDKAALNEAGFLPEKPARLAWPCFRSFLPGMTEWFFNQAEAEMFAADLRRVTGFARLLRAQPTLFDDRVFGEFPFWPRHKPVMEPLAADELEWHRLTVPSRPSPPPFSLPPEKLAQLRALPQQPRSVWEAGASFHLSSVNEPPRPYYTRLGLAVERESGFILGLHAGNGALLLEHTAAAAAVEGMVKIGFRPQVLHLVDDLMRQAFEPVAKELGITVKSGEELNALLEAMRELMQAMARRSW